MTTTQPDLALVLGATGGIGGEIARQLRDAGWQVRALNRTLAQDEEQREGFTWLRGDAMNRDDVLRAARGCAVIVHGVSPPGYRRWAELVLPMLDNTIAAAAAEQATVVLPGTVYNYGPDALPVVTEQSQQNPVSRKGGIRVEMERRLETFSARGGRVLIVRAGRLLWSGREKQLVRTGTGQARSARHEDQLSRRTRCGPFMGLRSRRGADNRRTARAARLARSLCHFPHERTLGPRWNADDMSDPTSGSTADTGGAGSCCVPVVVDRTGGAIRHHVS